MLPRRADYPTTARAWASDLVAGLTVGVVALPLAMGFGIASGAGAMAGLVTAVVAGFVAAVFGGSDLQVSGPTGAMTVVLLPAVATHGVSAVPTLAVLAGIVVVAAALLGIGRAIMLVPLPVVEGFTLGIAVIIFLQQLPMLLDVARPDVANTIVASARVLGAADWPHALPMLAVALGTAACSAASRRMAPRAPASLIAVAGATLATLALDLDVPAVGTLDVARIFSAPSFMPVATIPDLVPAALVVAFLAGLESLLSARVADGMHDSSRTDPDRELLGQGLANVASGLAGGVPATGAIARTAVNVRAGARTRVAAASHAVLLLVLLLGAAPLLARIPLAALAAVLMMAASRMFEPSAARALWTAGRSTRVVFVVTAATTVAFDLVRAVEVGVLVAAVLVLRSAVRSSGVEATTVPVAIDDDAQDRLLAEHIVVYRLQGSLFFGAAGHFLDELAALDDARAVVLRLDDLHVLDATGAHVLAETVDEFTRRDVLVAITGIRPEHRQLVEAAGIPGPRIARDRVFAHLDEALEATRARLHAHPAH